MATYIYRTDPPHRMHIPENACSRAPIHVPEHKFKLRGILPKTSFIAERNIHG